MDLGFLSLTISALAYLALAGLLVRWRGRPSSDDLLILAVALTAVWAAAAALAFRRGAPVAALPWVLEVVRDAGWLAYLMRLLLRGAPERARRWPYLLGAAGALCVTVAVLDVVLTPQAPRAAHGYDRDLVFAGHLILALAGLGLVENLFRNTPEERRWNIKFVCFGVGGLFAYDFFLYSHALLFRHIDTELLAARGLTTALTVPLLLLSEVRNLAARREFAISRRIAFHSATLIGAGIYLLLMSAAGYYIREFGGSWGGVLQAGFLFGAAIVLLVSLFSGSFRAYLRTFIEKNFFHYRYDYRDEWLRFIRTISTDAPDMTLPTRVVQAVGDIVDSPDGAVWMRGDDGAFRLLAGWNAARWHLDEAGTLVPADSALAVFLARTQWILNLDELARRAELYDNLALPAWLAGQERAWIVVPLVRRERLDGFMIFGRPRASRALNWEDYDLLKTVGQQAASYLAEHQAGQALAEARQFEEFNRRFAFVVHDIKNLASQLSLIVTNAARHGHDAEFQQDMLRTVRESVDKMKRLLTQLHGQTAKKPDSPKVVELGPMLRRLVERRRTAAAPVLLELQADGLAVAVEEDRLSAVVDHLVQNAVEAVNGDGRVVVRLVGDGDMAVVEVEDNGCGMDADFVRERLFQPFKTTKGTGYGIGAYESREFARALGGRLEVVSQPGQGTVMRMALPAVRVA